MARPTAMPRRALSSSRRSAIIKDVNANVLANQIARQWWEIDVSPVNRNHMWLENGMALYSEALWTEHEKGATAMEQRMKDTAITALTVDNVPLIQTARLEDYSPEYWALSAEQRRGRAADAAQHHGRREILRGAEGLSCSNTPGSRRPRRISARPARPRWARNCATSSSSGWSRTARRSSSWNTRFSARRKASACRARFRRISIRSACRSI